MIMFTPLKNLFFNVQSELVHCIWNVMAHAQKPDFVFRQNGRVHFNRRGHQFSWLLAAEVCASAVVMLDTPCSKVVWRVLATHSIRQFPLHFSTLASPCAIRFQLESSIKLYFYLALKNRLALNLLMSHYILECWLTLSKSCLHFCKGRKTVRN